MNISQKQVNAVKKIVQSLKKGGIYINLANKGKLKATAYGIAPLNSNNGTIEIKKTIKYFFII